MSNLLINTANKKLSSIRSTTENAEDVIVSDIEQMTNDERALGTAQTVKQEIILNTSTMIKDALDSIIVVCIPMIKARIKIAQTHGLFKALKAKNEIVTINSTSSAKIRQEVESLASTTKKIAEEMVINKSFSDADANEVIEQTNSILAKYQNLAVEAIRRADQDEITSANSQAWHHSDEL